MASPLLCNVWETRGRKARAGKDDGRWCNRCLAEAPLKVYSGPHYPDQDNSISASEPGGVPHGSKSGSCSEPLLGGVLSKLRVHTLVCAHERGCVWAERWSQIFCTETASLLFWCFFKKMHLRRIINS